MDLNIKTNLFNKTRQRSIKIIENLDWETLANLTGDIAALKRTSQTLNNRLNGMNKATIPQDMILQQMVEHQNVEKLHRGG